MTSPSGSPCWDPLDWVGSTYTTAHVAAVFAIGAITSSDTGPSPHRLVSSDLHDPRKESYDHVPPASVFSAPPFPAGSTATAEEGLSCDQAQAIVIHSSGIKGILIMFDRPRACKPERWTDTVLLQNTAGTTGSARHLKSHESANSSHYLRWKPTHRDEKLHTELHSG